jgi:hypothetical protein
MEGPMHEPQTILEEARLIKSLLLQLPRDWDGKAAIQEMKRRDYQWRQLEWIGFYGEMIAKDALSDHCRIPGKRYGNVIFDAFSVINWDIKVHPNHQKSAILNDREAIDLSIREHGQHGLIMLCVGCQYDIDGSFKEWHDTLKGGMSLYEKERIYRGAPSRKRKTSATLIDIAVVLLDEEVCRRLGSAQKDWRNADGSPRREKYSIDHALMEELSIR